MSVKIRLRRTGRKDVVLYRVVVADESAKRDGKVIETLGQYDPKNPKLKTIDLPAVKSWREKGAQPTEAVLNILKQLAS